MEQDRMHEEMWKHIGTYVNAHYKEYAEWMKGEGETCPPEFVVINNLRQIIGMEFFMRSCNDERYYVNWWLYEYPDEADMGLLMEIAMDKDLMISMLQTFMSIMRNYLEKNDLHLLSYMSGKIDEDREMIEGE